MSALEANMSRKPFCNQKLLYIILDVFAFPEIVNSEKKNIKFNDEIFQALQEVLVVAGGISGSNRTPGFGLGVAGCPFTELVPFGPVKNCLDVLPQKLHRLCDFAPTNFSSFSLTETIKEALTFVSEEAKAFASNLPLKLKEYIEDYGDFKQTIIILTWDDLELSMKTVAANLERKHAVILSSVKVCLLRSLLDEQGKVITEEGANIPLPIDTPVGIQISGDITTCHAFLLSSVFKEILVEEPGEAPHIKLTFSSSSPTLLLDAYEVAIDPFLLPCSISSKLYLQTNLAKVTSSTSGSSVPVHYLRVVQRILFESLHHSLVFGMPHYVVPSAAFTIPFNEFWDNSQRVHALCQLLKQKNEVLLCHTQTSGGVLAPYLVICPFNNVLLLMHLLPRELLLIETFEQSEVDISEKKEMDAIFNEIKCDKLKIEEMESGLVPAMIKHYAKTFRIPMKKQTTRDSLTPGRFVHPALSGQATGTSRVAKPPFSR